MLLGTRRAHIAVIASSVHGRVLLALYGLPTAHALPTDRDERDAPAPIPSRYIVALSGKPIATYGGDVKGLAATRPGKGERVDVSSGRAQRYQDYLEGARQRGRTGRRQAAQALCGQPQRLRYDSDARPGADAGGSPRCSVGDQGSTTQAH